MTDQEGGLAGRRGYLHFGFTPLRAGAGRTMLKLVQPPSVCKGGKAGVQAIAVDSPGQLSRPRRESHQPICRFRRRRVPERQLRLVLPQVAPVASQSLDDDADAHGSRPESGPRLGIIPSRG